MKRTRSHSDPSSQHRGSQAAREVEEEQEEEFEIHAKKYNEIDESVTRKNVSEGVMQCEIPPHAEPIVFHSYEAYDTHWTQAHANRCLTCGGNFPSEHFLSLHIAEKHDALVEVRKARGEKTYACFVEDCERVCSSPHKRKRHLIDKHMFPRNYDFNVIDDGIDRRTSLLRGGGNRSGRGVPKGRVRINLSGQLGQRGPGGRRSSSVFNDNEHGEAEDRPTSTEHIDDLTNSMSALQFVPTSVRNRQPQKQ